MIPGLQHDRVAAVLMRDGRAARLPPVANIAVAELLEAGTGVSLHSLAVDLRGNRPWATHRWSIHVRCELQRAAPALARIGVAVTIDEDRTVHLIDSHANRSAA